MSINLNVANGRPAISLVRRGAKVYDQGETPGRLYCVEFGCIMLARVTYTGSRQIGGFFFPDEVFGWECEQEHTFFAEAAGTSGVRVISAKQDPQTAEWLRERLLSSLARVREQLLIVSLSSAEARVAAFFNDLSIRQNRTNLVALPMHRLDIADYLGLTPETVSRVLRRFKEAGLIRVSSMHVIEVLNWKGLRACVDDV